MQLCRATGANSMLREWTSSRSLWPNRGVECCDTWEIWHFTAVACPDAHRVCTSHSLYTSRAVHQGDRGKWPLSDHWGVSITTSQHTPVFGLPSYLRPVVGSSLLHQPCFGANLDPIIPTKRSNLQCPTCLRASPSYTKCFGGQSPIIMIESVTMKLSNT